ncbi:MAG: hypothetical protein M1828_001010 [Chrysothrix sp. TS-e1954]|nr:MAG: hypothetical protein M1828_001010 [Chrysothrix sp. TS-e1954]
MSEGFSFETIASDDLRPPTPSQTSWSKLFHGFAKPQDPGLVALKPTSFEAPTLTDELLVSQRPQRPQNSVIPGKPRPITVDRKHSEQRYRLKELGLGTRQRKSSSGTRAWTSRYTPEASPSSLRHRTSAPEVRTTHRVASVGPQDNHEPSPQQAPKQRSDHDRSMQDHESGGDPSLSPDLSDDDYSDSDSFSDGFNDPGFQEELETRWILNLSMAFKDKSDREKFFITYAEKANRWRRLTVSCDYRDKPSDSLEADLKTLPYQRDKSARIYEAVRDSLPDIKFFDTVTNLKLETADKRLHVHVTEDVNEIIKYPKASAIEYLQCRRVPESDLHFDSHLSGFVYKVSVHSEPLIKKEIPGPDMIDEFLYEVNALHSLGECQNVINFQGVVIDDAGTCIKGLLISFADQGALVDILYDHKTSPLSWRRREKWARQIVAGLADIHEHGYVQGDFTLSNIVVDDKDDAQIIDINRRGCPVGWEPPEFKDAIRSGQRISMFIGVKSDLFQLGMVLWALAVMDDEPERADDLTLDEELSEVPQYFRSWIKTCLARDPRDRENAKVLLLTGPVAWSSRSASPYEQALHPGPRVSEDLNDLESFDPILAVGGQFQEDPLASEITAAVPTRVNDTTQSRSGRVPSLNGHHSSHLSNGMSFKPHSTDTHPPERPERDIRKVEANQIETTHAHAWPHTSVEGADGMLEEPEAFDDAANLKGTSSKSSGPNDVHSNTRATRFSPPLHQDSGIGTEEEAPESGSFALRTRTMSPPLHQDSGFAEALAPAMRSVQSLNRTPHSQSKGNME